MSSLLWLFESSTMVTGGDVLCSVSCGSPARTGCKSGLRAWQPRVCHGETEVSGWHQLPFRPSPARVPPSETSPLLRPINMGAWLVGKHTSHWVDGIGSGPCAPQPVQKRYKWASLFKIFIDLFFIEA